MILRAAYLLMLASAILTGCVQTPAALPEPELRPELRRARLLFAGDVMCHAPQITAASHNGRFDFSKSFEYVKPYFERADAAIVNFETTVSPDGRYSGYPAFSSPRELAEALRHTGTDIAVTANNHCCDRGARGIRTTAACIDSLGMLRTGAFADSTDYAKNNILRFERNGIRFALHNYTYGTNGIPVPQGCTVNLIDTVKMARDLQLSADADCRIVILHWGEEYRRKATAEQLALRDFLHRQGVEIIIGSHPHVVQAAEKRGRTVFVPSLGNFVSNQRKRYCDGGIMAELEIGESADGGFDCRLHIVPVWVKLPEYRILPPSSADTVRMTAAERAQYRLFMSDTEKLLYAGKFL